MSAEVSEFLKTYWPSIMSVVVAFLTLIIVFQIVGMNFTPVEDKHIEKVVTIESFDTEPSQEAIEKTNRGDLAKLHKVCGDFGKRACKSASYCVLLGGKDTEPRCVEEGVQDLHTTLQTEKTLTTTIFITKVAAMATVQKKSEFYLEN